MADIDPLKDVFGPQADPLSDVFGPDAAARRKTWETSPLEPKAPGALVSAAEGKTQEEGAADATRQKALKTVADTTPPDQTAVPSYLGHGLESGLAAAAGMAGDVVESFNPVTAARNMWLDIKNTGAQLGHAGKAAAQGDWAQALWGADKGALAETAAGKTASTPFTRFAERMQQKSNELAQTPDGQKYNQLLYATTDPSKSALLSPVRMAHDLLQSIPSTAAMAATVYLTRGAAADAYSTAIASGYGEAEATAIATKAAGKVASLAGALGEGVVGGLQQSEQTRVQVAGEDMSKSPVYQAMVKAGVSPADAKQYVVSSAGQMSGLGGGVVDAVTNLAEGPILGKIITEGGPLAARVAKGFLTEGTQEAAQGFGEQIAQNEANKVYADPAQKLADGVAENVIQSFVVGGLSGGAFATAGNAEHPKAVPGDMLGRAAQPQAPVPGRSYNVADSVAELGMTADEAKTFAATGKDPRGKVEALDQAGFTPEMTPDDRSSDIPDHILVEGKSLLGDALEQFDKTDLGTAKLPADILDGLIKRGVPEHIARGVAAGTIAESAGNPDAVNPTSGALGLGQWLGPRKQALIERYGAKPNLDQQLDFLVHELNGGDAGGKAVLSATDETSALQAYVHDFMRPGAAGETGDLQRGLAALGQSSAALKQQASGQLQSDNGASEAPAAPDAPRDSAPTVEGTLAQAGVSGGLGPDVEQFAQGQRLDVTRNNETVPGTVQEVYGEGDNQGVKVALDNGETFDELVKAARDYGARLTHPNDSLGHVFGPTSRTTVEVPDVAQPQSYAGEKINDEFTAFHPDTGTLGVPRADMPQVKQEHRGAFVNFLEARGITHEEDVVPAASLKPTQAEFAPAKVEKFAGAAEEVANSRAVLVSSDGYVLDGHHQWVDGLDRKGDVRVIRLNAPIRDLLPIAHEFPSATTSGGTNEKSGPISEAEARQIAVDAVRNKRDTAGNTGDVIYSFGQRAGLQRGPMMTPGKVNVEHRGQVYTFSEKDIRAEAAKEPDLFGEVFGPKAGAGPRVFVNYVGRDGRTDAERGHALPSQEAITKESEKRYQGSKLREAFVAGARGEAPPAKLGNARPIRDAFNAGDRWLVEQNKAAKAAASTAPEPIADQPTEAPVSEATANALREKAQPHQDELVQWGERWNRQGEEYGFINPGMKSAARIIEKLTTEGYESLDEIKDVARVGFKIADRNRATDIAVSAVRTFGKENVTDKGWRMVDGDYFDRKLIVSWPDGTKAEIQIIPDALETFRHEGGGSKLYTEWRSTEPGPEKDALLAKMEAGYAKAAAGTVWESFFNELKSASGKDLRAVASESEGPGLVANPGAGRQVSAEDQTSAQGRPDTAPEATNRSSTSKNENAAIGSNVGNAGQVGNVSSYGASNKLVTRERSDIARAIIRDKLKNQVSSGFDPEMLSAGMQLAAFHLEAGARKFADFTREMVNDFGDFAKLKPYLAAWYNGARDMLEGHGLDVSDMDTPETVREMVANPDLVKLEVPATVDDIGDNGGTNGRTPADQGTEGPDRTVDAGAGAGNAPESESVGRAGQGSERPGSAGAEQLRDGAEPSEQPRAGEQPEPRAPGSGERDSAGSQQRSSRSAAPSRRVRDGRAGTDYIARPGDLARTGSWHNAADRNLDIIELVNRLDAEGRPATPEEQKLLAKWVGWGASDIRNNLFRSVDRRTMTINPPLYAGEWTDTIKRAAELLKGDDLKTAMQSTQYAHYTSEGVVRGMWDAFQRMGFEGGNILEPGMGIGHFFTAAPEKVFEHSTYTGIELDAFTAKVAQYLLPQENVIQGDYVKQALPDGFFDAAIGNPPFANTKITDDPAYKKLRLSLHNYFFVKTLDKVRPGGLLAFVTSRYSMDALDPKQRQFMADRADLVGAIRLPQTAFKQNAGTEVVTDVLFFQRRMPGAAPGGVEWLSPKQVSVDGQKVHINQYFAAHPEMVLGRHKLERGMYRDNELTVEPYASKGAIEKQFAEAVSNLPENIYTAQVAKNAESLTAKTFERDFAPASSKEGGVYVKDGKVLVVDRGSGVPVEAVAENLKPADHAWLKGYVKLRDALKDAQKAQLQDLPEWESHLDKLRKEYRTFTKQNGRIKDFTAYERTTTDEEGTESTTVYRRFKWQRLLLDVEAPMVESLERITDAGEIEDGPFLLGRTLNKPVRPSIETVDDALAVTLDEIGRLDLGYIGKLIGKSEDEVVRQLGNGIYQTPAGEWQTSDEYLSGNVVQKLAEAKVAAQANPELQRNVEALEKAQPAPLSYDKITVKLGAPWLRPETISQFAEEVLGYSEVPITYEKSNAHWNVEGANQRFRRSNTSDFGTEQRSALELLQSVLNNGTIKITYKDADKKTVVDQNATAAANEAAKKISERFRTWLWEDSARTSEYVETYNRDYNNLAERKFNGDHLTLPGLSALFKPHPHVKRAVWRIIQTGNTYLAHAVGAGKTAEQIISGMEQRRLGLIQKPMYVVPNHMLKQFSQEFLQLYPAANIMVADEQAFHTGNRQRFLAQAALNDPDAIILTHSSFGKIDTSPEMRERIVENMVSELEQAMEDAKDADAPRHLVSKIEKQIETLQRRFASKTGTGKDKLLTFDEMGVDLLYVDEAHEFRKLDFATNRSAKGIDPNGSQRALDLFIKSQWLEQRNPGRSLVLASGTPVTNTMAELYTVMKYMAYKALEKDNIAAFDAWANMFGEVAPGYERNAAGGYEIVERFSKFVNVPELMKRVRSFMDVLTSAQLGDLVTRPKIVGGGPQNAIAPQSEALDSYMKTTLEARLKTSREWKPSKEQPGNPDPVINIITDARLSSIDMRFVDPHAKSDANSKLNMMIAKIAAKHHEFAGLTYDNKDGTKQPRKGGAQIIFSPVGLGEQVSLSRGFDVRDWIDSELVRLGVKKSEIGWMSDANTHAKKDQLQKDVRSGKVRILIGSPKNMGTGLNVQDRLKVLHFLAPPWFPADVTQPHGRIERQGNQNGDIEIHWYATEGTYDSTGWGMVARKQKFIDDAMSGSEAVRTLEDISEINMFEMAAALAAGDDRVIRIAELGGEVERLQRLKGAHADTQRSLRSDITTYQDFEIPRLEKRQGELKAAQDARGTYEPFSFTVGSEKFEKHGEAGEALRNAALDATGNKALEQTEIGKLYGKFPVSIDATRRGDFQLSVNVGGSEFEAGRPFERAEALDPVGIMRSIEGTVQRIPSEIQDNTRRLNAASSELAKAKAKYGAPFPEEQNLSEAIAERNRLQNEMAEETKAKEQPKAAASVAAGGEGFEVSPEQEAAIRADLQKQLETLGIADKVSLEVGQKLNLTRSDAGAQYVYARRLIQVALDRSDNPSASLAHETIHAMRHLGLFTPVEWEHMIRKAWADEQTREWVKDNYSHLSLAQQKEEAAAELFSETYSNAKRESFTERAARRVRRFLKALGDAVRKVLGKDVTPDMFDAITSGKIGERPEGFGEQEARTGVASRVEFDPAIEKRWQDANGLQVDGAGFISKAKEALRDFVQGWTRHYEHLPNTARFADFKEQARKMENAPDAAYETVVRHLTDLVGKLSPQEYDMMKRKVVLDDLAWEADREHELPFGFTPETLRDARKKIDAAAASMPKVTEAVRQRKLANYQLAKDLVKEGVLTSDQIRNPAYYRHMVLDYARAQIAAAQSGATVMVNGKPVRVRTPYWARRKGSTLDINSNLLEAEADWMLKAQTDIAVARTLNWLKESEHNIRDQLSKKAKDQNNELYAEALKHNPSARKDEGRLKMMMSRGFEIVRGALEHDLNVPDELQGAADAILNGSRDENAMALLSWIMDEKKPGNDGAALVLAGIAGRQRLKLKLLGEKWVDPQDIKGLVKHYHPEGFSAWQPLEGQHLFTSKTVPESVLDLFASRLAETEYPGVDKTELERAVNQMKPQLVVGRDRYTMVIPDEIAATLNDFGDKNSHNMFLSAVAKLQGAWKQYTLVNPRRWFRYNFNNMTGDLDAIIAGKASALLKLPQAWRELRAMSKGAAASEAYKEALDRGVFQAGITRQEVPDINEFKGLRHLERQTSSLRPDKLAVQLVSNVWNALKDSTQFRESLFRYATYLKFKEEIDAGKKPLDIGYGASNPALVDAVEDKADRAALLARELVGDYGNISVFGQRMRRYIMPFWSWPEMNTKRYYRLTANAFQTSYSRGAATGGLLGAGIATRSAASLLIQMSIVFALINMWNRWLHGDDEDKLDEQQQHQLHLVLGHDSQGHVYTLRMQGSLSDVIDELGFSDTTEAFKNWEEGKSSFAQVLLATPKAIVNRVGPGNWNPLYMEPIQLALREKLWPDMFQPRTIHDRARDVAQTFSLENEYDALADKPTLGYGRSWLQSFAYQRDPGEMAYNNTRDLVGEWMRNKEGLEIGRADISPRSEALRDYKLGMKFGDVSAAQKALAEYTSYGGTNRGLRQSMKSATPLHPLPKRDRKAFVASLTDHERDDLNEAQAWYEATYLRR